MTYMSRLKITALNLVVVVFWKQADLAGII